MIMKELLKKRLCLQSLTLIIPLLLLSACNKKLYTIVYASKETGNGDIYLTDSKAKSKYRITDHPENDGYPAWSSDGKRIAIYAYHDGRKTWSIHTMNSDGTNRNRLTHVKNKWDSSPAWSPDGSKIAFARAYADSTGVWQEEIWVMNSDGSEQIQISSINGGGPYFTNDGRIVFHSKSNTSEICIANIDGSNTIKLTNNNAEDWHPEVSPDGTQIAFISNRDGNQEIYSMDIDGGNQKRLTFNTIDDWYPSWSPDGSKLVFSSKKEHEDPNIYIMNKDGSSIKKFIHNGNNPSWLKTRK